MFTYKTIKKTIAKWWLFNNIELYDKRRGELHFRWYKENK